MSTITFRSPAAAGALTVAGLALLVLPACGGPRAAQTPRNTAAAAAAQDPGSEPSQPAGSQPSNPAAAGAGTSTASILQVSVKGMSCPQCAYNINQQLYKLPGVADVVVDLGGGLVTAKLNGPDRPTKDQVDYAIRLAGFTPDRIEFK